MTRAVFIVWLVTTSTLAAEPKSRLCKFTYAATVAGLTPNAPARVWIPMPPNTGEQQVVRTMLDFPGEHETAIEPEHGNKICYFATKANAAGEVKFTAVYTILRHEVVGLTDKDIKIDLEKYLQPDPLAPADGKHGKLVEGLVLPDAPLAKAKEFYKLVNGMLRYAKDGTEWGRGDVNWVCDSKFGNCTDFHSLFIALARSQQIPARFEVGFSIPTKRGAGEIAGYHCWAKCKPGAQGWLAVDISEANKNPKMADYYFGNLTEDRVTFTTGRGLTLVPKQDGPPLNFFIYPYVEVDGKPYPADKIKRRFEYEDVK